MISNKTKRKIDAAKALYIERHEARQAPGDSVYLGYFRAAICEIPENVTRRITAEELCDLVEAVELGWKHSRELERKETLDEGAIWDGSKMREIRA